MDDRPWGRCESAPGQNSAYRPPSRDRCLILVLAPDRARRAGVADRSRLVHRAERKRVLQPSQQAGDLDRGGLSGDDRDVANRAAPDATGARGRSALAPLDRVQCHGGISLGAWSSGTSPAAYGPGRPINNDAFVPWPPRWAIHRDRQCRALDSAPSRSRDVAWTRSARVR